jgi:hypothetical protein
MSGDNRGCFVRASVADQHHLREGECFRVRDRQEGSTDVQAVGAPRRAAMQLQPWGTAHPHDLDVLPHHPTRVPGAKRFHGRFFCGEAAGEMRSRIPTLGTIGNLPGGKHALQEALAVPLEDRCQARNVGRVEADTEDVHDRATA